MCGGAGLPLGGGALGTPGGWGPRRGAEPVDGLGARGQGGRPTGPGDAAGGSALDPGTRGGTGGVDPPGFALLDSWGHEGPRAGAPLPGGALPPPPPPLPGRVLGLPGLAPESRWDPGGGIRTRLPGWWLPLPPGARGGCAPTVLERRDLLESELHRGAPLYPSLEPETHIWANRTLRRVAARAACGQAGHHPVLAAWPTAAP